MLAWHGGSPAAGLLLVLLITAALQSPTAAACQRAGPKAYPPQAKAVNAQGSGSEGGDVCPKLRTKEECTPSNCIWCQNKYSPWPGSDGVCVDESQASQLPAWTYKCKHVKPTHLLTQPTA